VSFIKKYSVALPHFRISDKVLHPRLGRKGQHAVCYTDEDIITLAYQAAENVCDKIDALLFATTTPVFKGRYHASYLADLLGMDEGILALDIGTTSRAGTDALVLAERLLSCESHQNILIVAADVEYPAIGDEAKTPFGHAAVAMLLSSEKGIAKLKKSKSYSSAFTEAFVYKGTRTKYDPRFARTEGFKKNLALVLNQEEINPASVDQIYLNSPYAKIGFGQLKNAGFDLKKQLRNTDTENAIGHAGAAHGLLTLIESLEKNTGTTVLLDYLNGTNFIEVYGDGASTNSFNGNPEQIENYQDYLQLRKQGNFEGKGYQGTEMFSSEMMQQREKDTLLRLKGFKCDSCGTVYYLKAARCNACKNDQFTQAQLSKTGTVYSVTSEYYFPNSFAPTNMAVIDLDSGGRITVQQTDDMFPTKENTIKIGDKVKLVLRKMMENDKKPNYFWKCVKR
jgi:3-hydroxy-3-methylglutaryl CoA synthase